MNEICDLYKVLRCDFGKKCPFQNTDYSSFMDNISLRLVLRSNGLKKADSVVLTV